MEATAPPSLSAKFEGSFAYLTIRDRLPVILTKVVDTVCRLKADVTEEYGEAHAEELKAICGRISQLKYEVQTDKPVVKLGDDLADVAAWEAYCEHQKGLLGEGAPSWFVSPWLYVECYLYRRIVEAINLSSLLRDKVDPFRQQKEQAFMSSQQATITLATDLMHRIPTLNQQSTDLLKDTFSHYLRIALWGNKCDLSISGGDENTQTSDPLEQVEHLEHKILCDDTGQVWARLLGVREQKAGGRRLDIVLDNAGFELVTDLCFAELLLAGGFIDHVVFHPKSMPWFVSDVTPHDFMWTLDMFCRSNNMAMSHFGNLWQERLANKTWMISESAFWTLPHDYSEMQSVQPELYANLQTSSFIFFKGDLNYRKLTSDRQWPHTTDFTTALRGFHPAPLCTLRALKADLIVGLKEGIAEKTEKESSNWMISGNYAVIQYCGERG